jgi:hypothetical protein
MYRPGGKLLICRGKSLPRDKLKHNTCYVRTNRSRQISLSHADNKGGQHRIASDALIPARLPTSFLLLCMVSCNERGAGSLYIQSILYRRDAPLTYSAGRKSVMHNQRLERFNRTQHRASKRVAPARLREQDPDTPMGLWAWMIHGSDSLPFVSGRVRLDILAQNRCEKWQYNTNYQPHRSRAVTAGDARLGFRV